MLEIKFSPEFFRELKKLEPDLQEEAFEKMELFKNRVNHTTLRVHKLKGKLKGKSSFSVNYRYRIIFRYVSPQIASLLSIGDHDVYK